MARDSSRLRFDPRKRYGSARGAGCGATRFRREHVQRSTTAPLLVTALTSRDRAPRPNSRFHPADTASPTNGRARTASGFHKSPRKRRDHRLCRADRNCRADRFDMGYSAISLSLAAREAAPADESGAVAWRPRTAVDQDHAGRHPTGTAIAAREGPKKHRTNPTDLTIAVCCGQVRTRCVVRRRRIRVEPDSGAGGTTRSSPPSPCRRRSNPCRTP